MANIKENNNRLSKKNSYKQHVHYKFALVKLRRRIKRMFDIFESNDSTAQKDMKFSLNDFFIKKDQFWHKACNFIKKRLQYRCFQVNTAKFLRTAFLEHLRWVLLFG